MHTVCHLDKELYKCVAPDIVTDEVIITDERIKHIMERHPNDYERYAQYMSEAIQKPDYILSANKPHSAVVLKEFIDNNEQIQVVLRFVTPSDNANFSNSVITFMRVDKHRYDRYTRSERVLYKRE